MWQAEVADYLHSMPVNQPKLGQIDFNLLGSNQYFDAVSPISAAASGLLTLARALALVFGFGSSAMADANRKGQEKDFLDRTIA